MAAQPEEQGGIYAFPTEASGEAMALGAADEADAYAPADEQQDDLFRLETDQQTSDQHNTVATVSEQAEDQPNEEDMSAAELFEYRQKQYLLGKKVAKTIYSSSGGIIAEAGDVITEDMIDTVKREGKLIELVMNYEG